MKRWFSIFWIAISLAFATLPVLVAQEYEADSQAGNILFYMPRGWKRVNNGETTLLVAPLTPPQQAFIALFPAMDLKSGLRAAYNARWQDFKKGYTVLQTIEPVAKRTRKGYDAIAGGAALSDPQKVQWALFFMVAQNGTHAETVAFMSNVAAPDLAGTLQEVLGHVLESISFSGSAAGPGSAESTGGAGSSTTANAAKPVPLPKGRGKLNGIYRGIGVVNYGNGGTNIHWRYVVFFPDGRFMEGFPDLGMDNLDEEAEIRRNPVGWGSYETSGGPDGHGKIVFLITDPVHEKEPIVWDLKMYPDHVQVKGDEYNLLERCDGMKLEGTFRREDYKTLFASAQQGITFTADGRFRDEGVFKAAAVMVRNPVGNGYDFDDGAPGAGAYRIANYTLELAYTDGRVKRTSIFLDPGASKTGVREFYLNTYKFARVQ